MKMKPTARRSSIGTKVFSRNPSLLILQKSFAFDPYIKGGPPRGGGDQIRLRLADIGPPSCHRLSGKLVIPSISRDWTAWPRSLQDQTYELVREAILSERFTIFVIELMRWRKMGSWRNQSVTAEAVRLFSPIGDLSTPVCSKRHKVTVKKGK